MNVHSVVKEMLLAGNILVFALKLGKVLEISSRVYIVHDTGVH